MRNLGTSEWTGPKWLLSTSMFMAWPSTTTSRICVSYHKINFKRPYGTATSLLCHSLLQRYVFTARFGVSLILILTKVYEHTASSDYLRFSTYRWAVERSPQIFGTPYILETLAKTPDFLEGFFKHLTEELIWLSL